MIQRSKLWRIGAAAYFFINAAGAIFAVYSGEMMHAAAHVALLVVGVGVYAVLRLNSQNPQGEALAAEQANERIEHLQHALDSIALNVERIGEAQRFETRILEDRGEITPPKKEH